MSVRLSDSDFDWMTFCVLRSVFCESTSFWSEAIPKLIEKHRLGSLCIFCDWLQWWKEFAKVTQRLNSSESWLVNELLTSARLMSGKVCISRDSWRALNCLTIKRVHHNEQVIERREQCQTFLATLHVFCIISVVWRKVSLLTHYFAIILCLVSIESHCRPFFGWSSWLVSSFFCEVLNLTAWLDCEVKVFFVGAAKSIINNQ